MTSAMRQVAGGAAACLLVGLAASVLHARTTRSPLPVSTERLLFLRSGKSADRIFLSFDALASDVYWMRTIQHYGRDRRSTRTTDRFSLLQPLLDLTTTLDPRFNIAYRFGAIFLSMDAPNGPARPDQAIALLEKGLAYNPTRWQYAHDIAFIHYWYTGDYVAAARWFDQAAAMPGAPIWIRPLAAVTRAEGGDRRGARQMLGELLTANEGYIRQAAERSLAQLQVLDEIDYLNVLVDRYQQTSGHFPNTWTDLTAARLLPTVPRDPTGEAFLYDPPTHRVRISPNSPLSPLPGGLAK